MSNLTTAGNLTAAGTLAISGVSTLSSQLNVAAPIVQSGATSITSGSGGVVTNALSYPSGSVGIFPSAVSTINLGYSGATINLNGPIACGTNTITTSGALSCGTLSCTSETDTGALTCNTLTCNTTSTLTGTATLTSNTLNFGNAAITSNGTSGSGNIITFPGSINAQVTRQVNWISYYNSATQSIGASSITTILFASGVYKSYGTVPVSYSAGTFTNTSSGTIVLNIQWSFGYANGVTANSQMGGWINPPASYTNGRCGAMNVPGPAGTQLIGLNGSATLVLATTETFSIQAFQSTSGALNTVPASGNYPTQIFLTLIQ